MFDFSKFADGRTVIHCKTVEEVKLFFEYMFSSHPEYMSGRSRGDVNWARKLYGDEVCFWPVIDPRGRKSLEFSDIDFFSYRATNTYTILEFEDVYFEDKDLGEFNMSDIDISIFL